MDILFWSGGKDSYLALQFYRKSNPDTTLKLLTTYNKESNVVPHQLIPIDEIEEQASHLDLDLITVPLPPDCPNDVYLKKVRQALEDAEEEVEHLVFGDWKLEDIRKWRENAFSKMGYDCQFPIWKKDLNELLPELLLKPIEVKINAVQDEYQSIIRVGENYNQAFVRQLQMLDEDIDPMGENGEFHTRVEFKEWDKPGDQPLIPGSG